MLEVQNVNFCYKPGEYVVKSVSFTVNDGEFVAIAGRNGSGKTTVTRLIMSLLKPAAGRILLDGEDTARLKTAAIARQIGYVFQNPDRQIFRDTVAQEIAYGPEQLGFSPAEVTRAVEAAMAAAGLTELAGAYPRTLSKGQKQRVAIASTLAMKPRMMILDEPTSGQDAKEKRRLLQLLARLNAQGMTVILVTHDMELIGDFSRRVLVMADGAKVFDGAPARLFAGSDDVREWGLREPAAAHVARGLRELGLPAGALPRQLQALSPLEGVE